MMTADKWTDQELKKLENKIAKEYKQAEKELDQKAKEYFREYAERWNREEVYHQAGILSEDAFGRWFKANRDGSVTDSELKSIYRSHVGRYTDESFKAWEIAQLGRGAHWEDLKNQMTERLAQSAVIAQDYINGKLPAIYVKNSNEVAKIAQDSAMEQGITGIRFDLVDEYAVKRLMEGSREVKPYKPIVIDLPKTNRFNYTKLQNALIQGILQGDSIEHLADRFMKVSDMNRSSAIRNARTACTGAQNGGKQDRYADLASKGCEVVKMWIATPDERTRDEHMDAWDEYGTEDKAIPYDEPFEVGGESLMFPADLSLGASGWNVYNCRCVMRSKVKFKSILSDEMRDKANIRLVGEDAPNEANTEPQAQQKAPEPKSEAREDLEKTKIEYKEVEMYQNMPTKDEIIQKLAGGDKTSGSCMSLSFAYMGNLGGCDVTDFRGGDSQKHFCRLNNIKKVFDLPNVEKEVVKDYNEFKMGVQLLKGMKLDKEYCLVIGGHASMVRKRSDCDKYEYLELQSATKSGWNLFDGNPRYTLKTRFGCKEKTTSYGQKLQRTAYLVDPDSIKNSDEFRKILGYINTNTADQMKGATGYAK